MAKRSEGPIRLPVDTMLCVGTYAAHQIGHIVMLNASAHSTSGFQVFFF